MDVAESFGYRELRLPILESSELFKRSVGTATDIVQKEMYEFSDSKGRAICLRPEGTVGCAAAGLRLGLINKGQRQRLWYAGPFFRRERPQQGRYRQFHQAGVEAFGFAGANIEAELLIMTAAIWERLGMQNAFTLQINTLGDARSRASYREDLLSYLIKHEDELDKVSRERMRDNPLRILDSKHADTLRILRGAPRMKDYLDNVARDEFQQLLTFLDDAGIRYEENDRLVRGLDYYTGMVFEWVTDANKRQNTVCAGGRYDALVELLSGEQVAAAGFAVGIERVAETLEVSDETASRTDRGDRRRVYIVSLGDVAATTAQNLAIALRRSQPAWVVVTDCAGGTVKAQLKRAVKSGGESVLIIGDDELAKGAVTVKHLRDGKQESVAMEDIEALIATLAE